MDFEYAGGGVAVDGQSARAGPKDRYIPVDLKWAAGEQDGTGDAGGVDRVAVCQAGVVQAPAQGPSGAAVTSAGDSAGRCASSVRGEHDGTEDRECDSERRALGVPLHAVTEQ